MSETGRPSTVDHVARAVHGQPVVLEQRLADSGPALVPERARTRSTRATSSAGENGLGR